MASFRLLLALQLYAAICLRSHPSARLEELRRRRRNCAERIGRTAQEREQQTYTSSRGGGRALRRTRPMALKRYANATRMRWPRLSGCVRAPDTCSPRLLHTPHSSRPRRQPQRLPSRTPSRIPDIPVWWPSKVTSVYAPVGAPASCYRRTEPAKRGRRPPCQAGRLQHD